MILYLLRRWRTTMLIGVLAVLPVFYVIGRTTGGWSGDEVSKLAGAIDEERAQSMEYRLLNENRLINKALEQPLLGWGGNGRSRVLDETGKDISVTDGLWIITLGTGGSVSLAALLALFMVPVCTLLVRWHGRPLLRPEAAGLQVSLVIICLAAINNLPNADRNPLYTVLLGGVAMLAVVSRRQLAVLGAPDASMTAANVPAVYAAGITGRLGPGTSPMAARDS